MPPGGMPRAPLFGRIRAGQRCVNRADGVRLPFHCIEIADGSRDIAVGALVRYGHRYKLGRVEAAQITLR